MTRRIFLAVLATAILMAACQSTGDPALQPRHAEAVGYLVDPRLGFEAGAVSRSVVRRFESAWNDLIDGRVEPAEERFTQLAGRNPDYLPATLALAAIAMERNELDRAESLINSVLEKDPDYLAANIYRAELDGRQGKLEQAYEGWTKVRGQADAPPFTAARVEFFATQLFDKLYAQARKESDEERAIALLREALTYRPDGGSARILLVQKLVEAKRYDDARRQLEPLIAKPAGVSQTDIDEALAEIDAGKGRYQEAIARFERLNREDPQRFGPRLNEVKRKWLDANLPPQYHRAIASGAITREDLAVLLYWKAPTVRFAQAPQPPIAVDIGDVAGREEFVRALALRFFQVDPVTRSAGPGRLVLAGTFLRVLGRVFSLSGIPQCGRSAGGDSEPVRVENVLNACGIRTNGLAANPDSVMSGQQVAEILERLEAAR